jgi:hypothetical protein
MTKTLKKITRGEVVHYVTTLRDISAPSGQQRAYRQYEFLRELADGAISGILNCGPLPFETIKISHDGDAWVAVLEAEERQ